MNSPSILGFDVGGTKIGVVLGTTKGEVYFRRAFSTHEERGFQPVFDEMVDTAEEVLKEARTHVVAVSVSIGGPLDILNGIIKSPPNLPGWTDIPLKQLLARHFKLPVYVEHDGNAGALAEFYFGAGRGFKNLIFITMGTGFGGGLILDGRLYRGTSDVAGEVGTYSRGGRRASLLRKGGFAGRVRQRHGHCPARADDVSESVGTRSNCH